MRGRSPCCVTTKSTKNVSSAGRPSAVPRIIDKKGYVVGVLRAWFDPKTSGDKYLEGYLEGGGEHGTPGSFELLASWGTVS